MEKNAGKCCSIFRHNRLTKIPPMRFEYRNLMFNLKLLQNYEKQT